jgi:hypothetical protein
MSALLEVAVAGLAVWDSPQAVRPQPALLPPNEQRRVPDSVAVALQVAQAACANAGRDPALLATVFASTYGDLAITDYMCGTLARAPATLSPTRFHNSVHNAAAGYWSIATGCRQPYCALGAGYYSFAAGLFTAALQVCADQIDVLLVAYDINPRGPLAQVAHSRGMLGVAMVLSAVPGGSGASLQLQVGPGAPARDESGANAMAACLPLIAALQNTRTPGELLSLPLGPDSALQVRVLPG